MVKHITFFIFLTAASALGAIEETPIDPSDDFSPMLFVLTLVALAVVLAIFIIVVILVVIAALCCLILISLGIISTSALTGILRRRFSSGLRALHYQICAALALPAGIAGIWIGVWLLSSDLPLPAIIVIGSATGISAGLAVAFVLDHAASVTYRHFLKRRLRKHTGFTPRISSAPQDPPSRNPLE